MDVQVSTQRIRLSVIAISLLLLGSGAVADQAYHCIAQTQQFPNPEAWVLPANTPTWVTLGSMTLTAHEDSDAVVTGYVGFSEDNVPGSKIVYRIWVDGNLLASRPFVRKMPPNFPHSQLTVGYLSDLPAGDHLIELQAKNLNLNNDIYFFNAVISALYLDDSNDTDESYSVEDIEFDGAWTALGTTSVEVPADHIVLIGATTRILPDTGGSDLEFRFVEDSTTLPKVAYVYDTAAPGQLPPDGVALLRLYDPESTSLGTRSFSFEARNAGGDSTVARLPFFFVQTMPKYQLYDSDPTIAAVPVTVDNELHTVVMTQEEPPAAASRGDDMGNGYYGSYLLNLASFTPAAQTPGSEQPLRWRHQMVKDGMDVGFDGGIAWGHAEDDLQLGNLAAGGCGICGWHETAQYRVDLKAQAVCGEKGGTSTVDVASAAVQAVLIPNFAWFDTSDCGGWAACCNASPDCTFECEAPTLVTELHEKFRCPPQ